MGILYRKHSRKFQIGGFFPGSAATAGILYAKAKGTKLNPNNWGVDDMSKEGTFGDAYGAAKADDMKEFMYKGKRYSTKYKGPQLEEAMYFGNTSDIDSQTMGNLSQYTADEMIRSRVENAPIKAGFVDSRPMTADTVYSKKLARMIKLSNLVGNPKIRVRKVPENMTDDEMYEAARSAYHDISNKVVLGTGVSFKRPIYSHIISEYAHAYRNKHEGSERLAAMTSWLKKPFFTADGQAENYNTPGQMEYDAHNSVEPALLDYARGAIPLDSIKSRIKHYRKNPW